MKVIRGRKTRRKILAVILSVCMMFTASPNLWEVRAAEVVQSGTFDGTNLTWTLDADGILTISGSGAMTDYNGSTKKAPFYDYRGSIKKVVIQDGVTSIGEWTFYDHKVLESVTIPDSVKSIGKGAFDQCTALKDVKLPREMESIGKQAFNICSSLTSIVIPEGVTSIEDYTFSSCNSLMSVIIPEGVTSIGTQAFCECSSLVSVTIPNSVTSIKEQAFLRCALRDVTIPGSVTSIGYNAFDECFHLRTVTFQGTTTIPTLDNQYGGVFAGCQFVTRNTKGIHIPSCQYLSQAGWSDYESYIADAPHIKFSYTADGAVITQSCANCGERLGTATISVDSGADLNYTGSEIKPAKVTYSAGWVEKDNNKPGNEAIAYTNNTNAGTATAKLTIGGVTAQENFTIKAVSYTVTLHSNGGIGGTNLTSYTFGTGAVLPTGWTKTGYTFDGWYDNENLTGTAVTNISGTDTGDKEYWAKWTDNIAPVIGTLTYNYQPKNLWQWLIGKDSLVITVPVTEEGSGADKITYTETPDGGTAREETANIQNGEAKITVSADFKGTISIFCTDKAGNTSAGVTVGAGVAPNGIIIEDNAPEIAFQAENAELLPSGEYKTVPDIAVTVVDNKNNSISGGIASVNYKIGNGSEKTVAHDYMTSMIVNDSFTIPASEISAGETKITVTVTDNAGNSVTQNYTVKVHTHSGTLVQAVEPTCTTAGNKEYYTCTCGKWFSDSGCVNEIADHASVTVEKRGHDFSGEYQSDENGHWKVCSRCNVAQAAESHVFDDDNDTDCNQCGYRRNIGNQGNVSKDVEKDEKAPDTVLSDSAEELADIILTEEEKGQIGNGTDIKFILDVKDAGGTVSSGDKTAVQQTLDGNTAVKGFSTGQYLDISLFKVIGDTRSAISQTARKLTIVINVPDSLKSKDSTKPRTYAIIRVHDGVAEVLADLDSDADTVTIATDRFSAYALVYKEAGSGADVTPTPTLGGGDKPTPTPGGATPSPTPGEATPSPTPGGSAPNPTPGEATPSPTPGGSTPSPTPGGSAPNPTPGESTPSPVPEQQKEVNRIAKELNVPVETAKKLQEMAQELGIETDTLLLTNQDIVNQDSEGDVKGSFFSKLQAKATKAKKNSITLKWNKVKGASGYQIYAAKCGKNKKYKLVKTIKKASTTSFTYKKLKKGTGYKLIVKACKNVDGKEYTVAASKTVHEVTEGGNVVVKLFCNMCG